MLRRSASFATAMLTLLSFAACGGSPSATDGASTPPATDTPDASTMDGGDVDTDAEAGSADAGVILGHGDEGDAADDAETVVDAAPPPCLAASLPNANPCVVSEAYGVFVAANAAPGGDGTRGKPFTTLSAGITAAKASSKRVYACAGTYAEAIEIQNGVSMFGYFACVANAWTVGTQRARVQSLTSPAARAIGITTATRIEAIDVYAPDFGVLAPDATQPAKSSIGLLTSNAAALTFAAATIHAGTAQAGGAGAAGVQLVQASNGAQVAGGAATPLRGRCTFGAGLKCIGPVNESDASGPAGGVSDCRLPNGSLAPVSAQGGPGGRGGHPSSWTRVGASPATWLASAAAGQGLPATATSSTAVGGAPGRDPSVNGGTWGDLNLPRGTGGANGSTLGALTTNGFGAVDGAMGGNGFPGQGGGGGGAFVHTTTEVTAAADTAIYMEGSSGAAGGAGGCAGMGGGGGHGGGSSIAVAQLDAAIRLETVTFQTSAGGAGGRGGNGSDGTGGGSSGQAINANRGGPGAAGTVGGTGGSGRGGHSIAIAYTGTAPTLVTPTYQLGAAGSGVPVTPSPSGDTVASQPGVQAQLQKF